MHPIELSDLDKDYIKTQTNRFKGILNSAIGDEGKPLNDEKILAMFSILADMYNEMCYNKKSRLKKQDQKMDIAEKVYEAEDLASSLAGPVVQDYSSSY
jgi:hypothetical protein